jgi:hypothetical protein
VGQIHDPEAVNISVTTKLPGTDISVQMPENDGAVALITPPG